MASQESAQVRLIQPEEIDAWLESVVVPFLDPIATDADRERLQMWRPHVDVRHTWGVEDRGRFVGNAALDLRTITLPAGPGGECPDIPFAAVTAVGVHPTHRRRGLLRGLMGAMLADARGRGEVVAGLTASEAAIYGRFGFGWAVTGATVAVDSRHGAFARPAPELDIELLVGPAAAKPVQAGFERARRLSPGQVDRPDRVWTDIMTDRPDERQGRSARMWAVCDGGVASWRIEEADDGRGDHWRRARVGELLAETAEIEAALWRFLLDIDLVREVVVVPRPLEEPLRHRLVDPRALRTTEVVDSLWLRVLDTPGALTARGYLRPGRLVLDVAAPVATPAGPDGRDGADPAAGRWTLEAGPDGSSCRAARPAEATDLTLGVAELSALLGGEVRATTLAGAGRIGEERPGALLEADGLFAAGRPPLNLTGF